MMNASWINCGNLLKIYVNQTIMCTPYAYTGMYVNYFSIKLGEKEQNWGVPKLEEIPPMDYS